MAKRVDTRIVLPLWTDVQQKEHLAVFHGVTIDHSAAATKIHQRLHELEGYGRHEQRIPHWHSLAESERLAKAAAVLHEREEALRRLRAGLDPGRI